jgi:lipopolysaccharide transport system ATP-binding protein
LSTGEGRTVLFVSHNMGAVKNLCNHGIILDNGSISYFSNDIIGAISVYLDDKKNRDYILVADRNDRQGNGEIRIVNIKLNGKDFGSSIDNADQLDILLEFSNKKNIANPRILLSINTFEDECILFLDSNTNENNFYLTKKGEIHIFVSKEFALYPNHYYINVACYDNYVLADYVKEAYVFDVINGAFFKNGILPASKSACLVKQKWVLKEK